MAVTTCQACELQFHLTIANTVVVTYWEDNRYAWVRAICDRCNNENNQFLGAQYEQILEELTELGLGFIIEDSPSTSVLRQYDELYKTHWLDWEGEIHFFRYLLDQGEYFKDQNGMV